MTPWCLVKGSYFPKEIAIFTSIQLNHQPDVTIFQFIILTFIYSSKGFGRFPAHHLELNDCSGSLWFYLRIMMIVVLCSWSGRSARPRTQRHYHYDTKVKPEAATTVVGLQMMGEKTPETCILITSSFKRTPKSSLPV